MAERIEERVKLPEALQLLGEMVVRYEGLYEDQEDEYKNELLLDVVWGQRRYRCPMLFPFQGISFDAKLLDDLRELLGELVEREEEFEWRAAYIEKIERLIQMAAVRLFKHLVKAREVPESFRPKRRQRKA